MVVKTADEREPAVSRLSTPDLGNFLTKTIDIVVPNARAAGTEQNPKRVFASPFAS
jgi:hypothetical protein